MKLILQTALERLHGTGLADLNIPSPFTIPSGIVTTVPSVIARIAKDVPHIGFITTKTLSLEPREGYREPILHEYYPACFVNAVGLANPGAKAFCDAMKPLLPLHGGKPLIASIMGQGPEEFLECAMVLDSIADAFELNLSCPHVKGAGQAVGSDPDAVRAIIRLLKTRSAKPVIPKLSPNLGDVAGMARLCRDAGADALTLINTVGPGLATDWDGNPILSNIVGGLSGAGILPLGLKAVREAARNVDIPIIACGGISTAGHVKAYLKAGATLLGIGSALAGMTTLQIGRYFHQLATELESVGMLERTTTLADTRTNYVKTQVLENVRVGPDIFQLRLLEGPACDPGRFFFLRIPGIGEKPFSPAWDNEPCYLVRSVGPFTAALEQLNSGDTIFMRGPYGQGFQRPTAGDHLVLIGGGTGVAPIMMAARRWKENVVGAYLGFSQPLAAWFHAELLEINPECRMVVDPAGSPGEVLKVLDSELRNKPEVFRTARIFICGPGPMMRGAVEILRNIVSGDAVFTAREDIMRCGIGICGSCGTPGGLRSCVDGPVMPPE